MGKSVRVALLKAQLPISMLVRSAAVTDTVKLLQEWSAKRKEPPPLIVMLITLVLLGRKAELPL